MVSLGYNAGSSGTYNLSASGLISNGGVTVGYYGTGTFTQTGGSSTMYSLYLGDDGGSSGTYSLSGGSLCVPLNEYVGNYGTGFLTQSGGTNSTFSLFLGNNTGGNGTYVLSGSAQLWASSESVGTSGTATFAQYGGVNGTTSLSIGSSSSYLLAGGSLQVNGSFVNLGTVAGSGTPATLSAADILDLSSGTWQNLAAISLSMGTNSLLIVPAGFNLSTVFAGFSTLGMTHTVGSTLTVSAGQHVVGSASINDPVNCQGTILTVSMGGRVNCY